MAPPLPLSQGRLRTYLTCARRFQLQVVNQLPWPRRPWTEAEEDTIDLGRQFHQLLQRYFLDFPVEKFDLQDERLRRWWRAFRAAPLKALQSKTGRRLPELTLTVPIAEHLLHGRFDLLLLEEDAQGQQSAHIFDWKTGRPPGGGVAALRGEWQTRLYLALLAESGRALTPLTAGEISPEHISITYWFAGEPQTPLTIRYSASWHARNWAELEAVVADIDRHLYADDIWPLTTDWTACRDCIYQAICGRQDAGQQMPAHDEEPEKLETALFDQEPQLP